MRRICIFLFLWVLTCGKAFADFSVELDVMFKDSTRQCRFLYVLGHLAEGFNDTLAVFDTLAFQKHERVSLFYSASTEGEHVVSMVDINESRIESKPFRVSPQRTTFVVLINAKEIKVANKDYLYPQKNEDEQSYFFFLLIFFLVKIVVASIFIFSAKLPKLLIVIASGVFLLSSFIDWFWPFQYLFRFLIIILFEYLLFVLAGWKFISWWRAALFVAVVNMVGFGLIITTYLLYVFW